MPSKYQTFELVQSNDEHLLPPTSNIMNSNNPNNFSANINFNINLPFSLKSVYGRFVGLNLENIYSASRMAGRNIDQFYIIGNNV